MIKANELRVGNWVLVDSGVGAPPFYHRVIPQDIYNNFHESYTSPDWINPIPLTPEILEKAGFEKRVDRFKSEYLGISIDNGIDKAELIFYPDGDSKSVALFSRGSMIGFNQYYLHQVQNIYLDLTGGKELPINFKDLTYQ